MPMYGDLPAPISDIQGFSDRTSTTTEVKAKTAMSFKPRILSRTKGNHRAELNTKGDTIPVLVSSLKEFESDKESRDHTILPALGNFLLIPEEYSTSSAGLELYDPFVPTPNDVLDSEIADGTVAFQADIDLDLLDKSVANTETCSDPAYSPTYSTLDDARPNRQAPGSQAPGAAKKPLQGVMTKAMFVRRFAPYRCYDFRKIDESIFVDPRVVMLCSFKQDNGVAGLGFKSLEQRYQKK